MSDVCTVKSLSLLPPPAFLSGHVFGDMANTGHRRRRYLSAVENCNKIFIGMAIWRPCECSLALFPI